MYEEIEKDQEPQVSEAPEVSRENIVVEQEDQPEAEQENPEEDKVDTQIEKAQETHD